MTQLNWRKPGSVRSEEGCWANLADATVQL
jgi:hypothetical protein